MEKLLQLPFEFLEYTALGALAVASLVIPLRDRIAPWFSRTFLFFYDERMRISHVLVLCVGGAFLYAIGMVVNCVSYSVTQPVHIAIIDAVEQKYQPLLRNQSTSVVVQDPSLGLTNIFIPLARIIPSGDDLWVDSNMWANSFTNNLRQFAWASNDAFDFKGPSTEPKGGIGGTYGALLMPIETPIQIARGAVLITVWFGFTITLASYLRFLDEMGGLFKPPNFKSNAKWKGLPGWIAYGASWVWPLSFILLTVGSWYLHYNRQCWACWLIGVTLVSAITLIVSTSKRRGLSVAGCVIWLFLYCNLMRTWSQLELDWHQRVCLLAPHLQQ